MATQYNFEYYHNCCGPIPYEDRDVWESLFGSIADHIVADLHPKTVLDAGCAMGYLVAALRDRGVDAYGIDISEYAISNVRDDIKPFCCIGSLTEALPEALPTKYDLVVTIEVLEHLYVEDGKKAIHNLCQITDNILFSSSPDDYQEQTHVNVQQREYWVRLFAEEGFYDNLNYRPTYITYHAITFCRGINWLRQTEDYERFVGRVTSYNNNNKNYAEGKARFYFDMGNGPSEEDCRIIDVKYGREITARVMIPSGCKVIRFDPLEGSGCAVLDFQAFTDSQRLNVEHHNGVGFGDSYYFDTIDPQLLFEALPADARWLDVRAIIVPCFDEHWIRSVESARQSVKEMSQTKEKLETTLRELTDAKEQYAQREAWFQSTFDAHQADFLKALEKKDIQIEEQQKDHQRILEEMSLRSVSQEKTFQQLLDSNEDVFRQKLAEREAQYRRELAEKEARIQQELEEKEREIQIQEYRLSTAASELEKNQNELKRTCADLARANVELTHMSDGLKQISTELANYKEHYSAAIDQREKLKANVTEICAQLENYKEHYSAAINQREELKANITLLEQQLAAARNDYAVISNAACWKITKPLRVLLDVLKAPFHKKGLPTAESEHFTAVGNTEEPAVMPEGQARVAAVMEAGDPLIATAEEVAVDEAAAYSQNQMEEGVAEIAEAAPADEIPKEASAEIVEVAQAADIAVAEAETPPQVQTDDDPEPAATTIPITGNPVDRIECIRTEEHVKRLNLVTDSIDADSLLGGVATALIVATEFANRFGYELRIITRNADVNPGNYEKIMRINGLPTANQVSFFSDWARFQTDVDFKLDVSPDDVFFATSWWSATSIEETTIRERFFYIIQEVETFFYNFGSERLLCERIMRDPKIDFIVNSGYLYHYFQDNEPNVIENGAYFEPAFSKTLYKEPAFREKEKYRLFFYSRPNNPRNLFPVGVSLLQRAIREGVLDTNEWEIYCVGQDCPVITFEDGTHSINTGRMSWDEYAEFLSETDLGLCLMYTPHPSYPPYDVAVSGGVVLSNEMMNKESFPQCDNVIMAKLEEDALLEGLKDAVKLAKDIPSRKRNYCNSRIPRDWHSTLDETMDFMKGRIESVQDQL